MRSSALAPHRRWTLRFLALTLSLGLAEVLSYGAGLTLERRGVYYVPNLSHVGDYLTQRDPELGWPSKPLDAKRFNREGARHSPSFPDVDMPAAVSLYGDSFTFSDEVGHDEAWGDVLAKKIGQRVSNFGVPGYVTDQALLRFEQNLRSQDKAGVVLMCHLTENILRNVNQLRDLLYPGTSCGFKPRFMLGDNGELRLIPVPTAERHSLEAQLTEPESHLTHEFFLPGGSAGIRRLTFPFTWSICRALGHFRVEAKLRSEPGHAAFYRPDHPADGLAVTAAILRRFYESASKADRKALVLIIPTGRDLEWYQTSHRWPHEPLLDILTRMEVPVLDLAPRLLERMSSRPLADFYSHGRLGGHPNAQGYALIADIVHEHLTAARLLAPASPK